MTDKSASMFVYVIYIRTTPEALWHALTDAEFTRSYWFGVSQQCDWTPGAPWRLVRANGEVADSGEILECEPGRRAVIKWRNEFRADLREEGHGRCTIVLEPEGEVVKLTITHEMDLPRSELIKAVSGGWPRILSNLKSLLETGSLAFTPTVI